MRDLEHLSPQRTPTTANDPPCVRDEIIREARDLIAQNKATPNLLVSQYLAWLVNRETLPAEGETVLARDEPLFFDEWKAQKVSA